MTGHVVNCDIRVKFIVLLIAAGDLFSFDLALINNLLK